MSNLANKSVYPEGESYTVRDLAGNTTDCAKSPLRRGMTLRQHYAGLAMQGFCANPAIFAPNGQQGWGLVNCDEATLAGYALHVTDALLAELAKPTP